MNIDVLVKDSFQATSVLLVFVTVYFDIVYEKIKRILNEPIPYYKMEKERANLRKNIIKIIKINVIPFIILSFGIGYILLPLFFKILKYSSFSLWNFDLLRTAYIFVVTYIWTFIIWSIMLLIKLIKKLLMLKV